MQTYCKENSTLSNLTMNFNVFYANKHALKEFPKTTFLIEFEGIL